MGSDPADGRFFRYSGSMEVASLAILVVAVGALLWLGWSLAPFIFVALFLYVVFRYRREIPKVVRAFFAEFRKGSKKIR